MVFRRRFTWRISTVQLSQGSNILLQCRHTATQYVATQDDCENEELSSQKKSKRTHPSRRRNSESKTSTRNEKFRSEKYLGRRKMIEGVRPDFATRYAIACRGRVYPCPYRFRSFQIPRNLSTVLPRLGSRWCASIKEVRPRPEAENFY